MTDRITELYLRVQVEYLEGYSEILLVWKLILPEKNLGSIGWSRLERHKKYFGLCINISDCLIRNKFNHGSRSVILMLFECGVPIF